MTMDMSCETSSSPAQHRKPKLSRTAGNRSHGGCLTCKQRHIKCDETRPSCSKCAKKGLVCGGYPSTSLKWSYKHQPTAPDGATQPQAPGGSAAPAPVKQTDVDEQAQASIGLETEVFTPSWLLGFDHLEDIDQDFMGNIVMVADMPDLTTWQMDPSMATAAMSSAQTSELRPSASSPICFTSGQGPCLDLEFVQSVPGEPLGETVASATRLLDVWFKEVCPAWSVFDSDKNMNRKLAEDLWHSSPTVFTALQSMSTSFLSARHPHLRQPALSILRKATLCVQADVEELNSRTLFDSTPTETIFALLCVGTTICWLNPRRVGWPFLQSAKALVERTLKEHTTISRDEAHMLDFFNKSLTHWDMLMSFVWDPWPGKGNSVGAMSQGLYQHILHDSGEPMFDPIPHPWTGISSLTTRLFARTMQVCRTYRRRTAQPAAVSLSLASPEIEAAKNIEDELLGLKFPPTLLTEDTGDERTTTSHLLRVAEGYQLASLLQLYIMFPVLFNIRLPQEPHHLCEGGIAWYKWILPLALRLVDLLEKIPADSGSTVIQPLLYVCAATSLRSGSVEPGDGEGNPTMPGGHLRPWESMMDYLSLLDDPAERSAEDAFSVSQQALDVGRARTFILRRLSILKEHLHPGPITMAQKFVNSVWEAYDNEPPGGVGVCWIDIMDKNDLRTLLG